MYFLYLPHSLPSLAAPLSISPSSLISYSSVQPHYSCSLSSLPLSGRLTRNDRASCHGVWNTLNITCQPRDGNGWHGAEGTRAKRGSLPSAHFCLCLNPITGRLESSFPWLEVNECLALCSKCFSPQEARDANSLKSQLLKGIKCI